MDGNDGYAVFFFPQALEALGDAIKPYLRDGAAGPHVMCNGIDTGGSLIEMTLHGTTNDGEQVELELMVPTGMVRMIVSAHSDEMFGFGPHAMRGAVQKIAPVAGDPGSKHAAGQREDTPAPVPAPPQPAPAEATCDALVQPEAAAPAAGTQETS